LDLREMLEMAIREKAILELGDPCNTQVPTSTLSNKGETKT
jgi:hypothetical protein